MFKNSCFHAGIDATIPVSVPVFIASPNGNLEPDLGDPVNLTCLAEGHPPPSYQWFKDGVHINGETRSYLYISDAVPSSRGNYSCTASNSERVIMSDSVQLTIQGLKSFFNNNYNICVINLTKTSQLRCFTISCGLGMPNM